MTLTFEEIINRDNSLRSHLNKFNPNWDVAIFSHRIDLFYFTGTQQNGLYLVPREGESLLFVKRNFERARCESPLKNIVPMKSYRDVVKYIKPNSENIYINKSNTTLSIFEKINKYFINKKIHSLDITYYYTRAIKSKYELELQKRSGELLERTLVEYAPTVIREGISEYEVGMKLFEFMAERGHELITRMNNYNAEMFLGTISFSENACLSSTHDGPVGLKGLSPSSPFLGSRERKLRRGDIIVLDLVCNVSGYHTDKTVIYSFGKIDNDIKKLHNECLDIEKRIADNLKPYVKPATLYNTILSQLDENFLENFMGYRTNKVRFLGHGIGLAVDEYPVIANGFEIPLVENMTLAIEPKNAFNSNCMVGSENTYVVKNDGGLSITGELREIIEL